jgi:aminoglycoside phosphotransferase (APT) family kinase protein
MNFLLFAKLVNLHGDFHPANMMFRSGKLTAMVDFERYKWGDPDYDFNKVALFTRNVSTPFAVGQIHGYFGGEPPAGFWNRYALYAAMVTVSDFVWSS